METEQVRYAVSDRQARLTIDRPKARNALSADVVTGLAGLIARAEEDPEVRVVVLTGAGERAFCAGGDLSALAGDGFLAGHEGRRAYGHLLRRIQDCRKPTVACRTKMLVWVAAGAIVSVPDWNSIV